MEPTYPHPVPNMSLNVDKSPNAASISGMPPLGELVAAVNEWLATMGIKANNWVDISLPGKVMVVCNFKDNEPFPGQGRVDVLNGTMKHAEMNRLHGQWVSQNSKALAGHRSPKMQSADPNFHYHTNYLLQMCGATPMEGGSVNAYTDKEGGRIYINGHVDDGSILVHEYIHTFDPGDPSDIGWGFDEGLVDFFARDIAARKNYAYRGNGGYEAGYQVVKQIVDEIGLNKVAQFWFERPKGIFGPLSEMTLKIAESIKPGQPGTVTGEQIKAFCEKALSLNGWREIAEKKTKGKTTNPAKKWPTVQSPAGAFRSHG